MYYYVSKDDLETYDRKSTLHSIHRLFKPVNIDFPTTYERLHFISKFTPGPPDSEFSDYVLFFFDHLIFQVCRRFIGVNLINLHTKDGKIKEEYELYFRLNRTNFEITQYTNCLFVGHYNCEPEPVKVFKSPFENLISLDNQDKKLINIQNEPTKSPETENGSMLFMLSLALLFSFLTILLLVKSYSRFSRKSTETQPVKSNLVGKSDDQKLNELKQRESSIGQSNKSQNDLQLNSSNSSLSKSAIQSSQPDSPSTESANVTATKLASNQIKTEQNIESIKKKDKNYDI